MLEAGDVYPSGVVRGLIYRDYFLRDGLRVSYVSRLFTPLARLVNKPPRILLAFMESGLGYALSRLLEWLAYFTEFYIVHKASRFDVVYMSKVTGVRLVTRLRQKTAARLVLDFGDALWLQRSGNARFSEVLRLVDAVTTDNERTASHVRKFNQHCTVIPDCPQVEWFDQERARTKKSGTQKVTLGWIGSPSTAYNLYLIWEALERVFARHPNLHLRLVGVGADEKLLPPFEKVKVSIRPYYSQAEMIDEVLGMDIGLFPLQDVEASSVRGFLKAAVYMSGEAAVVCSPIGQCAELIQDGVNGMLARCLEEWEAKLETLISDPDLRGLIAKAGLETVRLRFSVESSFSKLRSVLDG